MPDTNKNWLALAILAGFAVARLLFAFSIGLGIDESYTIAISGVYAFLISITRHYICGSRV